MTTGAAPTGQASSSNLSLTCQHHPAIDAIAATWDGFVPRDVPHLRAGFLRAAEHSGLMQRPDYLLIHDNGRLVAVALAYTLYIDSALTASPRGRSRIEWVRKFLRGYGYRPLRVCGSPVGNSECGVYFDPCLTPAGRRPVFARIAREISRSAGFSQTLFFKEFKDEEKDDYASQLESLGFFAVDPSPGTRLLLPWSSFDDYVGAMRTKYRKQLKKDLKVGEALEFSLLDSFADLAAEATTLYRNVVAHAAATLQVADEHFFTLVSEFEQAHLLVARLRSSGQLVGINLLLFGDTCMHNIYVGFDYEQNKHCRIYFNLLEQSLRLALERKCRIAYFGQTSYEFKARIGAVPYALTAYMKHRLWPIHHMLRSAKDKIFPKTEDAVASDVFRDAGEKE